LRQLTGPSFGINMLTRGRLFLSERKRRPLYGITIHKPGFSQRDPAAGARTVISAVITR
jgi:hypothetical protein